MKARLLVEGVGEAAHAAAHAAEGFRVRIPGGQQEGGHPARLAPVAVPPADGHQVQGVPQTLAVVPERIRGAASLRQSRHLPHRVRLHYTAPAVNDCNPADHMTIMIRRNAAPVKAHQVRRNLPPPRHTRA